MKKCFIVMVLLIGVLSCRTNRVDSYEMKVFNEIFDNLVEEMGALDRFEIPLSPQTTLTIKVLHARHPKRNPFLRPFWVLSFYLR